MTSGTEKTALGQSDTRSGEVACSTRSRRISLPFMIVLFVLLAIGSIGLAAAFQAQKLPGALFSTDTAVGMVLGTAEAKATVTRPITLQEGGDAEHEMPHVFEPLKGGRGLARGLVMRDGSAVEVSYDPDLVTEEQIVETLRGTGYVQ